LDPIQQMQNVQYLRVSNFHSEPVTLCLEPWADEIIIPPKVNYVIKAEGPAGGYLEVAYGASRITVYGWSGSILFVFSNEELLLGCRIPAPLTPST
jgi:hypothetical protein